MAKRWFKGTCQCCGDHRTIIHVGLYYCWKCYEGWRIDYDPTYDKHKRSRAYRKHGLTEEAYDTLLKWQGNVCAICKQNKRNFVVDHDHNTGNVRGILCRQCNTGLGQFSDTFEIVLNAAKYLANSEESMKTQIEVDLT